jgi:hypothetical protein
LTKGYVVDSKRFDGLCRALGTETSRRSVLGGLGALGLTALVREEVLAACADNGTRCGREGDLACCSGRCVRKRGTRQKFCREAPGQGICTVEFNSCSNSPSLTCGVRGPGLSCFCYVTSRGYSYCGGAALCFTCETDTDCEKWSEGQRGDRCVECTHCPTTSNRACARKCPEPD